MRVRQREREREGGGGGIKKEGVGISSQVAIMLQTMHDPGRSVRNLSLRVCCYFSRLGERDSELLSTQQSSRVGIFDYAVLYSLRVEYSAV